jgi:hypothetical protein
MDRERAEAYLRWLIETELRRVAAASDGRVAEVGSILRAARVANVLTAAGCLGDETAGQLIDDLRLALEVRRAEWPRAAVDPALRSRFLLSGRHPAMPRGAIPALSPPGDTAVPAADRVVPVGQLIPVRGEAASGEAASGEICLLAYAQTEAGALLTLAAAGGPFGKMEPVASVAGSPAGPARSWGEVVPPVRQFTATDAAGTSYRLTYRGNGTPLGEWTVRLSPAPPHDVGWLDLRTTPDGPAVRIDLDRPLGRAQVTVREVAASPGEQLLRNLAMCLLIEPTAGKPGSQVGNPGPPAGSPLADVVDGLGDVLAALQAAGALSPLSPVPGQFAALCAQLDLAGHGITAPPARDLPAPWLSLLAHRRRRRPRAVPGPDGYVVAAVGLPELDGVRISLLGLHNSANGTVAHVYVSRQAWPSYWGPAQLNMAPAIWLRDSHGGWHGTRFTRSGGVDVAMRLQVVPPLSRSTSWIEVFAAGQSAKVRATVPVRWR